MTLSRAAQRMLMMVAVILAGCGTPTTVDHPTVNGRRVQGTSVSAEGSVPYRVAAYELVFRDGPHAALLVDFVGGHGVARGFVEWLRPGEPALIYVAEGWARQRPVDGQLLTVIELRLQRAPRVEPASPHEFIPVAVRVVVHETTGEATLTRRR